ncbi:BCL2/adenovirus E1B 19 kDa protein-interacting protein 3-like isoform X2 [Acipenser ruthenus]|uniref:BCL2/adenovirus E1B 19 kDa protein-interacting protein 3 isoform X2 n=1 Tax=Acipenser ruthenus TaxID=7906 RepID=UPI0015617CF1|nr:BCL2/adenovirus E1B 19 kDa protein-interacting protein 3 isoform X2 [Acipenser ruthenus]XP_058880573.1 BCL2/adenovirus E1B 19 kDa protein-interacting protein 3-like isoform X2 [Acipenser ruthenus]
MSHHGQDPEDNLHSSWVELQYSQSSSSRRSSVGGGLEHMPSSSSQHQGDMEQILLDAQLESDRNSSSDSPPLVMRPKTAAPRAAPSESGSSADHTSTQSEEDGQERAVEVESMLKSSADWIWDWSSRPENLPPKEFLFQHPKQTGSLSMRKARMMKKGILSSEFLVIFIPSIVVSHLLTLGLGIYIGKRLAASTASTL